MESKKWYCDECGGEFETQEELDDHLCIESEEDEDLDEEDLDPAATDNGGPL